MAIPAKAVSTVVDTDLSPDDAVMFTSRVDEAGARRIMSMLVDMYADPVTAVVREYVANAVDATVAAGANLAVEVATPDVLSPNLVVTDRGTGMTAAEVEAVFLAFAASTKRDTNEQVGGLGVGAKSAWTVADSFLIDTVKAGRRTVVRAARDLAHHVLVADSPTDLAQGTSITIPIDEESAPKWRDIVQSVAKAHKPGTVIVDGKPVTSIQGGPRWVGPVRCGVPDAKKAEVTVLSGGTLFAVPDDVAASVFARVDMGCVLELPVGTFDHTPSRESLIATPRTKASVDQALAEFDRQWATLKGRIAALVATDVMAAQALRAATLGGDGNSAHLPIKATMELTSDMLAFGSSPHSSRQSWRPATSDDSVPLVHFGHRCQKLLIVTGWPTQRTLRGVATYANAFAPQVTAILALRGTTESVALPVKGSDQTFEIGVNTPGVTVVSYTEMQSQLAERRSGQRPARLDPTYQVKRRRNDGPIGTTEMSLSQLCEVSVPVVYAAGGTREFPPGLDDGVLVLLERKSANRFTAAVPNAVEYTQWAAQQVRDLMAAATELDLEAVALNLGWKHGAVFRLAYSLADHVPDARPAAETLNRMKAIHARASTDAVGHRATREALAAATRLCVTPEFTAASNRVDELAETLKSMYPLTAAALDRRNRLSDIDVAHLGEYLRAVAPMTTATDARTAA